MKEASESDKLLLFANTGAKVLQVKDADSNEIVLLNPRFIMSVNIMKTEEDHYQIVLTRSDGRLFYSNSYNNREQTKSEIAAIFKNMMS